MGALQNGGSGYYPIAFFHVLMHAQIRAFAKKSGPKIEGVSDYFSVFALPLVRYDYDTPYQAWSAGYKPGLVILIGPFLKIRRAREVPIGDGVDDSLAIICSWS